ncbi:MAG: hypothetical protein LBT71_01015 [Azoarcus sp.]|nr:hypothetical protein [Azoarcus sp.]
MTSQTPSQTLPLTMAERRAQISHDDLAFCTSYLLYCLIETNTRPDNPNWININCRQFGGTTRMMVFRSPIDAMVTLIEENKRGFVTKSARLN